MVSKGFDPSAWRSGLREAAYDLPSPPAVPDDLSRAVELLERALHLAQNGERAPGGDETWGALWRDVEAFLRGRLDGRTGT